MPQTIINVTIDETQVDSSSERNSYVKTTYGVTTQVTVTLTDLTKIGGALRAAVDAGANRVDVSFGTTMLRQARDQARAAAIKAAREKGRDMAIAAGIELGRVRSFSEQSPWWGSAATQNSVQNLDRRVAADIEAGGSVDDSLLFGEGPIVVDAEVTLEIAVK